MFLLNWNKAILLFLLFSGSFLYSQRPVQWEHNLANLPENFNLEIAVTDQHDRIWLANHNGLWLFDGNICRLFIKLDIEDQITALHVLSLDSIVIGTQSGKFYLIIDRNVKELDIEEGFPEELISQIHLTQSGQIWIGTSGEGLYHYDGGRLYNINEHDGLPSSDVADFVIDQMGHVWIATDNGISKLRYIPDSLFELKNYGKEEGLTDPLITSISYNPSSNIILAGTHQGGLFQLEKDSFRHFTSTKEIDFAQRIFFINESEILVYANKPQMCIVNIEKDKVDRKINFQTEVIVPAIYTHEGFVWLFHEDRLLLQLSIFFTKFETTETPQAILCNNDSIWIGTKNGLFLGERNDHETLWKKVQVVGNENIISLEQQDDVLLIGTFGNGLFRFQLKNNSIKQFGMESGLPDETILDIYDDGEYIWLGTLGGLIKTQWNDNSISSLQSLVDTVYVYHIASQNDRIYFSTHGDGAGTINGDVNWFRDTILAKGEISTFALLPPDKGLFVTTRKGLIYKDGDQIFPVYTPSNISLENTSAIAADHMSERFYVSHSNGLDIFDPLDSSVIHLGNSLKLNFSTTALNAYCYQEQQNVHLFGTADGFYSVSSYLYQQRKQPEIEVLNIWVNNKRKTKKELLLLNSDEHTLQLELMSRWYTDPKSVNYRYMIKGFHHDWVTTSDQKIIFPELPYGAHKVKIQAGLYGNYGPESEIIVPISIAYPIWLRPWFIVLLIILLVAAIYAYIKTRESKLQRWAILEKEKANAQIQALKSQVSPHFMFNSFNTLIALIEETPNKAVRYAEQLSDFFRDLISKRDEEIIPLKEEIDMIQNYISLLKTRYGDNLKTEILIYDWDGYIITYTLQILTENVIKHNVISRTHPLTFSIIRENDTLIVRNRLQPKFNSAESTGFGLESIKERYKLIFNKEIEIDSTEQYFTIKIPILKHPTS